MGGSANVPSKGYSLCVVVLEDGGKPQFLTPGDAISTLEPRPFFCVRAHNENGCGGLAADLAQGIRQLGKDTYTGLSSLIMAVYQLNGGSQFPEKKYEVFAPRSKVESPQSYHLAH